MKRMLHRETSVVKTDSELVFQVEDECGGAKLIYQCDGSVGENIEDSYIRIYVCHLSQDKGLGWWQTGLHDSCLSTIHMQTDVAALENVDSIVYYICVCISVCLLSAFVFFGQTHTLLISFYLCPISKAVSHSGMGSSAGRMLWSGKRSTEAALQSSPSSETTQVPQMTQWRKELRVLRLRFIKMNAR